MRDVNVPRWVRIIALGSALTLATFGGVGLLCADLDIYSLPLVLVLGLPALFVLGNWIRPVVDSTGRGPHDEPNLTEHASAAGAVVLSVVAAFWNAVNASQHAQINRDGGLYLNAGRWIASHGTLNVQPFSGPFARTAGLVATSTGMEQQGAHLEFQISHMLPAFLAEAENVGGNRLMFMAVPLLSGAALLAFYLLAARLLRQPIAALGATATLALLMPQISFSRDSTTEIPIQLLLFTSLWLLCDARTLHTPRPAFVAGLLLGLVQAMHVDGLAFLVGLPAVFAVVWLQTNAAGRVRLKAGFMWAGSGIAVGLVLGAFDIYRWDRSYLSVVRANVERLAAVEVVAIAAAIATIMLARRTDLVQTVRRRRRRVANGAGVVVLMFGFGAWFVRPLVQQVHAATVNSTVELVQRVNHLAIDGTRRYSELAVRWISWYVGPITLTVAIIGAAALTVALVRGSLRLPAQIATYLLAPPALLYIWRPTITPDQIWAARRFLPAVFPATILLAFAVLCGLARVSDPRFVGQRRSLAIVLAIATVAFPWLTIRDVSRMTEQRNLLPVISTACRILGHNSAVVVLQDVAPASVVYLSDPQTLRSFCDVPVAVMLGRPDTGLLHSLSGEWKAVGRRMFVVAFAPQTILRALPHARLQRTGRRINAHFLEQTLTRRPDKYTPEVFQLTLAQVPAIAGTVITPQPLGGG